MNVYMNPMDAYGMNANVFWIFIGILFEIYEYMYMNEGGNLAEKVYYGF